MRVKFYTNKFLLLTVNSRCCCQWSLAKAIGATQEDILLQFVIEAVIVSAAGGLVGTAIGVGGVMLVGALTPLNAGVSPLAIAAAVGVSGGIGLFFGVVPARRAAQLDPIVALRSA